ncbi:AAEL010628-PA [Aedes aegypti]|uniref:AAEL010628-PA n=2 Tax=Aedes aegypti TaxID=7159 RepID=A0A1S4FRC0_AEDAE|nr:uncharacterized protein LOC5573632 [Aedes aegypti]EAT37361.1 AAEL010628-PA [Aedes aegypti]
MQRSSVQSSTSLLVALVFLLMGAALPVDSLDLFKECAGAKSSVSCFGNKMVQSGLKRLSSEKSLQLFPGVDIVEAAPEANNDVEGSSRSYNDQADTSVLGRIARYLTSHELKINFGELARKSDFQNAISSMVRNVQDDMLGEMTEARKKDKGGLGMILLMKVMMSKMLGALGFGAVAALAMKALGVSMMALVMAGVIGLKKLADGGGDHKGRQNHDADIQVLDGGYGDHYDRVSSVRRRRSLSNLAYRGWTEEVKRE